VSGLPLPQAIPAVVIAPEMRQDALVVLHRYLGLHATQLQPSGEVPFATPALLALPLLSLSASLLNNYFLFVYLFVCWLVGFCP